MEAVNFSGYATKNGLKCSDGRTIMNGAFKHMDQQQVPLVWQHQHNNPENILGHAVLEHREDGVYAYAFFNDTEQAKTAQVLVEHKDVKSLSIYANNLTQRGYDVHHGDIKEVSLVLAGANPGALIDFINLQHSNGDLEELNEAIIYTGLPLENEELGHADAPPAAPEVTDETVQDVVDSMTDKQKAALYYLVGVTAGGDGDNAEHSDIDKNDPPIDDPNNADAGDPPIITHTQEDPIMTNVFEQQAGATALKPSLSHDQLRSIIDDAQKLGSFKESFLRHAVEYGIENIDFLFPDAKTLTNAPELVGRRTEWVSKVIDGAKKNPFSRIKTLSADITHDEARAKGYVKGTLKKEEWFGLTKRVTTPTTVYKKQKLDRDDIIDITDLDVVAWLKAEMRIMLDEEIARAALIGDGREVDDEDKINESNIRPIAFDDDFYTHKVTVPANVSGDAFIEAILRARPAYRGSGNPTMFTTEDILTDLLLIKDKMGRRLYETEQALATALRVSSIVTVDVLNDVQTDDGELQAVLVNMGDYTFGADRGGNISMFDDFDIDYNQYKYLIETRLSGALTKFKTAIAVSRSNGTEVTPAVPTFVSGTGVVTIPTTAGVTYKNADTNATLSSGAQTALASGATLSVQATPNSGYFFPHNFDADWDFTRP